VNVSNVGNYMNVTSILDIVHRLTFLESVRGQKIPTPFGFFEQVSLDIL
jgi:hypothetical protein